MYGVFTTSVVTLHELYGHIYIVCIKQYTEIQQNLSTLASHTRLYYGHHIINVFICSSRTVSDYWGVLGLMEEGMNFPIVLAILELWPLTPLTNL